MAPAAKSSRSAATVAPRRPPVGERRARRRQQIVEAAARLFAAAGYSGCEMDRVAAKLKIAKGTLYLYFPGKRALFFACVDAAVSQLRQAVQAAAQEVSDPFEQIGRAVRAYLAFFDRHPHYVELFVQERAIFRDRKRPAYFEYRELARGYWRELYARLIREGLVRPELKVETILDTIGNLLYGAMFANRFLGCAVDIEAQHRAILDIIMNGLVTDAGRARRRRS